MQSYLFAVADKKILKKGGRRQFISPVVIYRKCTQQTKHAKRRLFEKKNS